jgi:hypothetical protein
LSIHAAAQPGNPYDGQTLATVYTSDQKRRLMPQIKREFKRLPPLRPSSAISSNITA